jgi:undecaprenyl-diphosphatase
MSGLILSLENVDERILHAVVLRRHRFADVLMRAVTTLGNPFVVSPLSLSLALGVLPPLRGAGIQGAFALVVSHLAAQLLKRSVVRPRPELPVGRCFLVEPEDGFSFPSGHAAAGLSVALPLFLVLSGPVAVLVLLVGLAVGASRCYFGVHYPGDVLVGWTLAAAAVVLAP